MLTRWKIAKEQGMDWYEERSAEIPSDQTDLSGQLVLVSYGTCVYWIDNEKVIAERGDLLFIPSTCAYYGKSVPTVVHEKYTAEFSLPRISPEVHDVQPTGNPGNKPPDVPYADAWFKRKAGMYDLILERFKILQAEFQEQGPYYEMRGCALLMEIMALFNRELQRGPHVPNKIKQVDRMKSYIASHYREKVTKEDLGAAIGRSPNHAAMLFKEVTGQTISGYVHAVRMKTGLYLLTESLLNVGEISRYLGYQDVSYFQKMFRRINGRTPSDYLKERS
ncbi:helix-turn-helix domain-containing protein [Paenibacillus beijingensis]|uniref:HTH araC/xylS-type domain-containing protein n=1 Tax=Paenibacillus beijingensis TaxID=1126833 RepID=A0A0D5NDD9_9BACL|nr:AraC family transcriptional regulator [Paenibacillus beijingensis]AJY73414.1 hypothetical protein VN24_00680 [Paenibacillus beijingensis]